MFVLLGQQKTNLSGRVIEPLGFRRTNVNSAEGLFWYALQIWTGKEKVTSAALKLKSFDVLLPLSYEKRQWSDRSKLVENPLFPGYTFCRFPMDDKLSILTTPNVMGIVGVNKTPVPIPDEEIENVRTLMISKAVVEPHPFLSLGQRVFVNRGPLRGVNGVLATVKSQDRLVVSISLLQRSISVEVDRHCVQPFSSNVSELGDLVGSGRREPFPELSGR
jgi:transcription antitermination factor NusG